MAEGTELLQRIVCGERLRRRKNARADPGCCGARSLAVDEQNVLIPPTKLPRQRQTDDSTTDNQEIMHREVIRS